MSIIYGTILTILVLQPVVVGQDGKKEAFIGLLPPNSERTVRLNLHNTSEEAFEFDTITRSCNCVTIRPTAGVIQPQGDFGLSVTVRSAAEEGEFTNTVFLVDSTTGATKPLKLRFRVLPLATVNDGVPIRICREGKENSTRFMIKSDYPGVLLDQYELAVTSEVLVNAVVTYRHDGMVLVVSDIKRDGLEPGVLTTTALVGFRKKNETAVDIPVIPLPIEITDAIRVFRVVSFSVNPAMPLNRPSFSRVMELSGSWRILS